MIDAPLEKIIEVFRGIVERQGEGGITGWPTDHQIWRETLELLVELQNWRTIAGSQGRPT